MTARIFWAVATLVVVVTVASLLGRSHAHQLSSLETERDTALARRDAAIHRALTLEKEADSAEVHAAVLELESDSLKRVAAKLLAKVKIKDPTHLYVESTPGVVDTVPVPAAVTEALRSCPMSISKMELTIADKDAALARKDAAILELRNALGQDTIVFNRQRDITRVALVDAKNTGRKQGAAIAALLIAGLLFVFHR